MSQPHPTIINAPLNFRTSDTLITTKVPHYPTKVNTGTLIIPGWTRPNANGMNPNINQADFNGPDFKARPLKHWRRQLRVYNNNGKGPSNNSRTARIADLDRPGLTVYHNEPDCACVDNEGGNSYIIANNKFSYETKGNQYSEPRSDSTIQNNGFNRVPSNATAAQVADPLTPAYETLTGVYNTKCINCSPQHNVIKGAIAYNSQAYYADSFAKQQSRCQTYEQNISTNRADTSTYFGADGEPLWPNNSPTGPQVVEPVNYGSITYKGNFFNLYDVIYTGNGGGSFSYVNSIHFTPKITCNVLYVIVGLYVNLPSLSALIEATIYDLNNNIICKSMNKEYTYINTNSPFAPSFSSASLKFYFPQKIYINPSTLYYVQFKTINNINFDWLTNSSFKLSGTLVAERLNCVSETIYKPNNVGFGRQGAVSGATRLRKLVADTVMLNGNSFYSAAGAAAANLGLYQGTNVAGNYYVKMKPVVDSCLGGKPCVPFILSSERGSTTITLEWIDGNVCDYNSRLCNVLYYNLTYYPISEPNNINHILIPASNGYIYTIQNLTENKSYNFFMSATNGNGTSDNSELFLTSTLFMTDLSGFIIPDVIYGDPPFQVSKPISNRPGDFSYSSSNTNVATVSNNGLITIRGAGSVTITATQAATDIYMKGEVSATLTVSKAVTTITPFTIPNQTYGYQPYQLPTPKSNRTGAFIYSSNNTNVVTLSQSGLITISGGGSTTISVTQAATDNYLLGTATANITVARAVTTITPFTIPEQTYGDVPYQLPTPVSNSPTAFSYSSSNTNIATISQSGLITISGGGSTTITVMQEATANYLTGTATANITVARAVTTITPFTIPNQTYGDVPYQLPTPISSRTGDFIFIYSSSNTNIATISQSGLITIVGAGSTTISVTQAATDNYLLGTATANITVARAVTKFDLITIPEQTYGDPQYQVPTHISNSPGAFIYSSNNTNVATISQSGLITIVGVGITTITFMQAATANYLAGTTTATLTVKQAVTIITPFTIPNKTYGDVPYQLPTPISNRPGDFSYSSSNTNIATISQSGLITIVGEGSTTISVTQAATDNYMVGTATANITVARAVTTITPFTIPNKTYGDVPYQLPTPISNRPGDFSYSSSNTNIATISQSGLITIVGAGSTTISVTQAATDNYLVGTATATLTVKQAVTIITPFTIPNKTYGDVPYQLPTPVSNNPTAFSYSSSSTNVATISQSGLITIVGGGTTTITVMQEATIEDDTSPTVTGIALQYHTVGYGASNSDLYYANMCNDIQNSVCYAEYRLRFSNGVISKLTINSYAGENQGLTNPDILFALTNIPLNGVTAILQGKNIATNSTNHIWYDINIPSQEIVHNQATVKFYGNTSIFKASPPLYENNYLTGTVTATLTVEPAVTTITPFTIPNQTYGNQPYQLPTPISSRPGEFVYSSQNTNIATVSHSGLITIRGAGSVTITATQAATANYLQGSESATFTIPLVTPTLSNFFVRAAFLTQSNVNITITPPTSNSNGAFTYSLSDLVPQDGMENFVSISGNVLTAFSSGWATVIATQHPDGVYGEGTISASFTSVFEQGV